MEKTFLFSCAVLELALYLIFVVSSTLPKTRLMTQFCHM